MLELFEAGDEARWRASFSFFVDVRPRYHECDGQNHLSNVVYPAYLELSRLRFFARIGDPEPFTSFAFQHVTAELSLRYVAACYYDEALRVGSKLVAVGRSSALMEQGVFGADPQPRALARIAIVRAGPDGNGTQPWSAAQRAVLAALVDSG